jgi:hypothetical protein
MPTQAIWNADSLLCLSLISILVFIQAISTACCDSSTDRDCDHHYYSHHYADYPSFPPVPGSPCPRRLGVVIVGRSFLVAERAICYRLQDLGVPRQGYRRVVRSDLGRVIWVSETITPNHICRVLSGRRGDNGSSLKGWPCH